ncbi:MAG: DUF1761 domain-containing protein [Bacteroidota bacterium]
MNFDFSSLNWLAVGACLVFGQAFLSVWFIVLFGTPWAKEYGVQDKRQHTKEIPGYTYGVQALCTFLLVMGLAIMQPVIGIDSLQSGISFGLFVAVFFSAATALPGYIFLKRMNAFAMAMGSQAILIVVASAILAIWK